MTVSPLTLHRALVSVTFPADRRAVLSKLHSLGAPQEVVDCLEHLPDRTFRSRADVSRAAAGREGTGR